MKESTPDDIAVLCSHVNVDRNRYRVFFRENDDFRQVAIETANEGVCATGNPHVFQTAQERRGCTGAG